MRKSACVVIILFVIILVSMLALLVQTGMDLSAMPFTEALGGLIFIVGFCAAVYGIFALSRQIGKRVEITYGEKTFRLKHIKIKIKR